MTRALLLSACWLIACGEDGAATAAGPGSSTSASGSGGGGGAGNTSVSSAGGGGGGGPIPIGPPPTELVDRGLLARYFINEAVAGQDPTALVDSSPEPLDLPISYGPELAFVQNEEGHRGLQWSAIETDWRASVAVADTKLEQLEGKTEATLEIVVEILESSVSGSRLLHIADVTESGRLTISTPSATRASFFLRGFTLLGAYEIDFVKLERVVLHAVLDTQEASPNMRARFYRDGAPLAAVGGTMPDLADTITLPTTGYLSIGNRVAGDRSANGTIYYAAIYTAALSDEELLQNAIVLLADDDSPGPR